MYKESVKPVIEKQEGKNVHQKSRRKRYSEDLGIVRTGAADPRRYKADIFIPGTTKYTADELTELLKNEEKPIYVAADEADICVGYAFCQLKEQPFSNNMVPFKSLFIDDLCVDQEHEAGILGKVCLNI